MGVSKRNPWLSGLGVLLAVVVAYAGLARADVTSDTPGSIVIFPKVIADGTRDTLIQLTNTSNSPASAHCWYFDATNNCQPHNFSVDLTPQQPVFWRASAGRHAGDGSPGIFLGSVPPLLNFQGELKCVQVDASDTPVMGNSLKGEALLEAVTAGGAAAVGQVSEYNAIAVQAKANPAPICVGGPNAGKSCSGLSDCCDVTGACGSCNIQLNLDNVTYNACPQDLVVTHYSDEASDLYTGATVKSEITLVPCTEDIENDRPTSPASIPVIAQFRVVDEAEDAALSGSIPFTCWLNVSLDDSRLGGIYDHMVVGTIVKTRIPTLAGANQGLIGVLEEFHTLGAAAAGTAATNLHGVGARRAGDVITLPQDTGTN